MKEKKLKVIEIEQSGLKISLITEAVMGAATIAGGRNVPRPCLARVGDDTVAFVGNGDVELICGRCSAVLARNVRRGQLWQVVLLCHACDAYNDTQGCGVSNLPPGQRVQL